LTGDAIHDSFLKNWCAEENAYNDRKIELLDNVLKMWREWYYAVDKAGIEIQNRGSHLSWPLICRISTTTTGAQHEKG
jgi:hypothetical protein